MKTLRTILTIKADIPIPPNQNCSPEIRKQISENIERVVREILFKEGFRSVKVEKCNTYDLTNTQVFLEEPSAWEDE
jgi:hypothetical protein